MSQREASCELCQRPGGVILWQAADCRVVRVADRDYPGFCRVIWHEHVREMSDLPPERQERLMRVVFAVEAVLRRLFAPDKINLASLGNQVPHLHWHVIGRWADDRHFPEPIWGRARNEHPPERPAVGDEELASALQRELQSRALS